MQINRDSRFGIVHINFPHLLIFQLLKSHQSTIFSSTRYGFLNRCEGTLITIKKQIRPWLTQKQKKA
jgi:hypothetical protein